MYCLHWKSYKNNLCNGFAELQQREEFVDMTLVAEGHQVKVHKNIVSLASPYIKNIIKSVPCTHPIIFLTNISLKVLRQLLEYIYTGQVNVETVDLNTFVKAASELQLPGIVNEVTDPTKLNKQKVDSTPKTLGDRELEFVSGDALTTCTNDIANLEDIEMVPVDNTNSSYAKPLNPKRKYRKPYQLIHHKKQKGKEGNGDAVNADGSGNIALVTETPLANNDNNPLTEILLTNTQQCTNTLEKLPTSTFPPTSNSIQILENRLLDCGTLKYTQETNYIPQTNPSLTVLDDAIDNLDEFLKFSDPPNSRVEEISSAGHNEQLQSIDFNNRNTKLDLSLDLCTNILPQVQYTISNRGSLQMILNRYIYSQHYSANRDVKRRWRCVDYRSKHCPAYVDTENDQITLRKHHHNHPYHDDKIEKKVKAKLVFGSFSSAVSQQNKMLNTTQDSINIDTDTE